VRALKEANSSRNVYGSIGVNAAPFFALHSMSCMLTCVAEAAALASRCSSTMVSAMSCCTENREMPLLSVNTWRGGRICAVGGPA